MRKNIQIMRLKQVKDGEVSYECMKAGIKNPDDVFALVKALELQDEAEENFVVVSVNTKHVPLGVHYISRGSLNASIVHPREVFKHAMMCNASAIMLVHNHPSGDSRPSVEDIAISKRLVECGQLLGIAVLDHVIVGDYYRSMREAEDVKF